MTVAIVGLAVAGCAVTAIGIAHLDSDKVIVEAGYKTPSQKVFDRAAMGCAVHDKVAQLVSTECVDKACTVKHFHFACI